MHTTKVAVREMKMRLWKVSARVRHPLPEPLAGDWWADMSFYVDAQDVAQAIGFAQARLTKLVLEVTGIKVSLVPDYRVNAVRSAAYMYAEQGSY